MNVLKQALDRSRSVATQAQKLALSNTSKDFISDNASTGPVSNYKGQKANSSARRKYDQYKGWVYSAINVIARKASSQPVHVARVTTTGTDKRKLSSTKSIRTKMTKCMATKYTNNELEILGSHPLSMALEHPNKYQSRNQFVYMFVCNLILTGRSFVIRDTNKDGQPCYLALPSSWVRPDPNAPEPYSRFIVSDPKNPGEGKFYDATQVGFAYLPDPADPTSSKAPAEAQDSALTIDEQIQTSQTVFFDNGIFPSVMIIVGKNPLPGGPNGMGRPILTPEQRRQVYGVLRRRGAGIQNSGEPAILDGMIEDIKPMSHSHREMGWEKSEEAVKKRILSAYGINPFVLGEKSPGSYAQMYIVYQQFFDIVNDYLDVLSNIMTMLCMGEDGSDNLLVFYEKCIAVDPEMERRVWEYAAKEGLVNQNEYRAWMGLGPDPDGNQKYLRPETLTPIYNLLKSVGEGSILPEQVIGVLECVGVPTDFATRIAGKGKIVESEPAQNTIGNNQNEDDNVEEEAGQPVNA